jgi:multiple sugar transport system permease protein
MKTKPIVRAAQYLILFIVTIVYLIPFYWLFIGVFKRNAEHNASPPIFFKFDLAVGWANLKFAIFNTPVPGGLVLFNSLSVSIATAIITVVLGALAAYSFARYNTGGKRFPFLILCLRMIPPIAIGLPFFLVFRLLGLTDTRLGLIIAYVSLELPFVIWLLRSFFREMDPALEEAARIDGANEFQVLTRIALPLSTPALATAALLVFISSWNEFFFAILLTRFQARTLPTLLPLFLPRELAPTQPLGSGFAIAVIGVIPVMVMALLLQRYFIYGLTFGSVKG